MSGRIVAVKLKPCPFCGGGAGICRTPITQGYEYYVSCDKCKSRIGLNVTSDYSTLGMDTAKTMVSLLWNNRVDDKRGKDETDD